jgi:AraC family transcriptional regulator
MQATPVRELIRRSIMMMHEHYHKPLKLDDLARSATLSKFYFLRQFRMVTGVTPGRFLSAVRIHEAKRLLFDTSSNVADISIQVGYDSPGTFTRRFTECVGLSPTRYRLLSRGDETQWTFWSSGASSQGDRLGSVSGVVIAVPSIRVPIFIGLYRSHPQGLPVAATVVGQPGPWRMPAVPAGDWHLLAVAGDDVSHCGCAWRQDGSQILAGIADQVRVQPCSESTVSVTIERLEWSRPPLLVAVPGIVPAI